MSRSSSGATENEAYVGTILYLAPSCLFAQFGRESWIFCAQCDTASQVRSRLILHTTFSGYYHCKWPIVILATTSGWTLLVGELFTFRPEKKDQAVSLFLNSTQHGLACLCGAKLAVHSVVDFACGCLLSP